MQKQQAVISGVVAMAVSLALGVGGVSLGPAVAGTLEPPAEALQGGGGTPSPTMKTLEQIPPTWSQRLPCATQADCPRFEVLTIPNPGGRTLPPIKWGVLDHETGLVWEQSPRTDEVIWSFAGSQCLGSTVGDKMGWRLPSVHELASLVDPTNPDGNPDLPAGHPFSNVQATSPQVLSLGSLYWAATLDDIDPPNRWFVRFSDGNVGLIDRTNDNLFVWCVRGGSLGPATY